MGERERESGCEEWDRICALRVLCLYIVKERERERQCVLMREVECEKMHMGVRECEKEDDIVCLEDLVGIKMARKEGGNAGDSEYVFVGQRGEKRDREEEGERGVKVREK